MPALIRSHHGVTPAIAASAFVAETAVVIGDVTIGDGTVTAVGHELRVLGERDPAALPWRELEVDVAVGDPRQRGRPDDRPRAAPQRRVVVVDRERDLGHPVL